MSSATGDLGEHPVLAGIGAARDSLKGLAAAPLWTLQVGQLRDAVTPTTPKTHPSDG